MGGGVTGGLTVTTGAGAVGRAGVAGVGLSNSRAFFSCSAVIAPGVEAMAAGAGAGVALTIGAGAVVRAGAGATLVADLVKAWLSKSRAFCSCSGVSRLGAAEVATAGGSPRPRAGQPQVGRWFLALERPRPLGRDWRLPRQVLQEQAWRKCWERPAWQALG